MLAAALPPVSFFFPDRTRSVSEAGAAFLVAQLQGRPDISETVANLAERIAIESRRGRFAPPGQDLDLHQEEQQELLDTLKATAGSWRKKIGTRFTSSSSRLPSRRADPSEATRKARRCRSGAGLEKTFRSLFPGSATCQDRGIPDIAALEHRWNTSLERYGLLRTSMDSANVHDSRICLEIAESASWTRLTRNEGVPGSSPGVGSPDLKVFRLSEWEVPACAGRRSR
jgi:hypothetical protein